MGKTEDHVLWRSLGKANASCRQTLNRYADDDDDKICSITFFSGYISCTLFSYLFFFAFCLCLLFVVYNLFTCSGHYSLSFAP